MNYHSASLLIDYEINDIVNMAYLQIAFSWFQGVLDILLTPLDQLTELNYRKLNSEPTNHG